MKRFLPVLLAVAALFQMRPAYAQEIRKGDKFADEFRTWTVQEIRMGTIVYMTTAQGDELTLEKFEAEEGVYILAPSRQADDSPFAGANFGDTVMFMREDGNMILAVVDAKYNLIAALRPVVERRAFRFETSFVPLQESPGEYDRIEVKGSAGSSFAPEFETELQLAQTIDDAYLKRVTKWVNDQIDLNFDGIPDLMVHLGLLPTRGVPDLEFGYVWNPDKYRFEPISTGGLLEPDVDPVAKTITCGFFNGPDTMEEETYVWKDGKLTLAGKVSYNPFYEPHNVDGCWYNGSNIYSAKTENDGNVSFYAMSEGQEMGFLLIPTPEAADTYRIADPLIEALNEYEDRAEKVVYREAGEWDVLCFYGADGSLCDAMWLVSDEADSQELNINQWVPQICGEYTVAGGHTVKLEEDRAIIDGQRVPMKVETFNGEVMGVVSLEGQGPLKGSFKLEPTKEGLKVSEMVYDEDTFWFKPTGVEYRLVWNDNGTPRFDFTSDRPLNGGLLRYDKSLLRLMRNAILARHGYVFQSKDLKEYFSAQSWYRPAANNADIQLSFIEQLNVDLIKAAEKSE